MNFLVVCAAHKLAPALGNRSDQFSQALLILNVDQDLTFRRTLHQRGNILDQQLLLLVSYDFVALKVALFFVAKDICQNPVVHTQGTGRIGIGVNDDAFAAFEAYFITGQGEGWLLRIDPAEVDLVRFVAGVFQVRLDDVSIHNRGVGDNNLGVYAIGGGLVSVRLVASTLQRLFSTPLTCSPLSMSRFS